MEHDEKIPRIFNSISLPLLLIDRDFVVVAANAAAIPLSPDCFRRLYPKE